MVGNPEDRFSHKEAHIDFVITLLNLLRKVEEQILCILDGNQKMIFVSSP